MKYTAVANSSLYHCGYRWLVIDEKWNAVSEHVDRQSAEKKADEMNAMESKAAARRA